MPQMLWVGGLGVLGVLSRYGIDLVFTRFAWGWFGSTFLINLAGSFAAGLLFGLGPERAWLTPELKISLMVGFLGGFTTFSAFSVQGVRLLTSSPLLGIAYVGLSPLCGVLLAYLGMRITLS